MALVYAVDDLSDPEVSETRRALAECTVEECRAVALVISAERLHGGAEARSADRSHVVPMRVSPAARH